MHRPQPTQPSVAELVLPGAELVGEPLAVAGPRLGAQAAAVDVGELLREARVPHPPRSASSLPSAETSSTVVQKQVGQTIVQFMQVRHRLPTSSHTGLSADGVEQVAEAFGVHRPAHPRLAVGDDAPTAARSATSAGSVRQLGEHLGAQLGADLDHEAVRVHQLGQRQVVAVLRVRPAAHRGAEARPGRLGARHRGDERALTATHVAHVGEARSARMRSCRARALRSHERAPRNASRPHRGRGVPVTANWVPLRCPRQISSSAGKSAGLIAWTAAAWPKTAPSSARREPVAARPPARPRAPRQLVGAVHLVEHHRPGAHRRRRSRRTRAAPEHR